MEYTDIYIVNTKALLEKGEEATSGFLKNLEKELLLRISKKKNEKAKNESILCYSLLSSLLLKEGLSKEKQRIAFSESGKPYLLNNSSLAFSVSHTDGAACVAINKSKKAISRVGVDIEKVSEKAIRASEKAKGRFFEKALPVGDGESFPIRVFEWAVFDGDFFEKGELEALAADIEPLKKWCEGEAYFKMKSDIKCLNAEEIEKISSKKSFSVKLGEDLFTVAIAKI